MRYKIIIEYDGTHFIGWQRQRSGTSVQSTIELAILKFSGEKVAVCGAGRTDAGVHAMGQVAHFDLCKPYATYIIQNAINHYIREYFISILSVEEVDVTFHARFSALQRGYLYKILNRPTSSPLMRNMAWHIPTLLNIKKMQEAALYLKGRHDFSSFRASKCQAKNTLRVIDEIELRKIPEDDIITLEIAAPAFLHNQVRIIVGTLIKIGLEKWDSNKINELLLLKDRTKAGATAPAHGLYFLYAKYS